MYLTSYTGLRCYLVATSVRCARYTGIIQQSKEVLMPVTTATTTTTTVDAAEMRDL